MKAGRIGRSLIMFVLGVCMFLGLSARAQASDYLGTYCWLDDNGSIGIYYQLAATDMGDNHFLVNGIRMPGSSGDFPIPISGNAELINGNIYANLTGNISSTFPLVPTSVGNTIRTRQIFWTLDPTTLNGVEVDVPSDAASVRADVLTLIPCP